MNNITNLQEAIEYLKENGITIIPSKNNCSNYRIIKTGNVGHDYLCPTSSIGVIAIANKMTEKNIRATIKNHAKQELKKIKRRAKK